MTAEANRRPPTTDGTAADDDLRHYTPEEAVDPDGEFRLPTTALMLRKWAYARKIPHSKLGGRVSFTRADIRGISETFAVAPVRKKNSRKTPAA